MLLHFRNLQWDTPITTTFHRLEPHQLIKLHLADSVFKNIQFCCKILTSNFLRKIWLRGRCFDIKKWLNRNFGRSLINVQIFFMPVCIFCQSFDETVKIASKYNLFDEFSDTRHLSVIYKQSRGGMDESTAVSCFFVNFSTKPSKLSVDGSFIQKNVQ